MKDYLLESQLVRDKYKLNGLMWEKSLREGQQLASSLISANQANVFLTHIRSLESTKNQKAFKVVVSRQDSTKSRLIVSLDKLDYKEVLIKFLNNYCDAIGSNWFLNNVTGFICYSAATLGYIDKDDFKNDSDYQNEILKPLAELLRKADLSNNQVSQFLKGFDVSHQKHESIYILKNTACMHILYHSMLNYQLIEKKATQNFISKVTAKALENTPMPPDILKYIGTFLEKKEALRLAQLNKSSAQAARDAKVELDTLVVAKTQSIKLF